MASSNGLIKSAERTADILELVARSEPALTAAEVADTLELPRSSVHGLLHTMTEKGLLSRSEVGTHTLGGRLFAIASAGLRRWDIGSRARPEMEVLSSELRLTSNLGILEDHHVIYVEKVQATADPIRIGTFVGAAMPAHTTAMGKVLVAEMDEDSRAWWVSSHEFTPQTEHTRTSSERFLQDLDRYRRLGYAVDNQEFFEGVMCVAAPIRDHSSQVVAALSVTGITSRLTDTGRSEGELGEHVVRTAAAVSRTLGHSEH